MTAPQNRPTIKPKTVPRPPAAPAPAPEPAEPAAGAHVRDPYLPERAPVTMGLNPLYANAQPQVGPDVLELMARLSALEAKSSGGLTEPTPQPQAPRVVADPVTLTSFQAELVERTRPTPVDYQASGITYNHPNRHFMRPDGMIVALQGGPPAIQYYLDKGFVMLTAEETERWLKVERPLVVKRQTRIAQLINGIRRMIKLNPQIEGGLDATWDEDLAKLTIPELEEQWQALAQMSGQARVSLPRPARLLDNEDREVDRQMAGVETADSMSKERLEAKLGGQRGQGRLIEMSPTSRR